MEQREWFSFCTNCSGSCVEIHANPDGTFTLQSTEDHGNTYTGHELDEFAKGWLEMREHGDGE